MAKESSNAVSLLAAIVVAVTGLIPVVWLLTSPAEQSVVEGEVVATTTTSPEVTTVFVEPTPELEVDELNPSVVRVLQANGYAELAGEPDDPCGNPAGGRLPHGRRPLESPPVRQAVAHRGVR